MTELTQLPLHLMTQYRAMIDDIGRVFGKDCVENLLRGTKTMGDPLDMLYRPWSVECDEIGGRIPGFLENEIGLDNLPDGFPISWICVFGQPWAESQDAEFQRRANIDLWLTMKSFDLQDSVFHGRYFKDIVINGPSLEHSTEFTSTGLCFGINDILDRLHAYTAHDL